MAGKWRCPRCKSDRIRLLKNDKYWCGYCSFEFMMPLLVGEK
jgi:DNA-directed RNA polymerase subunit RPC12/RpoP